MTSYKRLLALAVSCAVTISFCNAEDWTTTDGKTYKSVTIIKHDDATVTIIDDDGGATVPLANLPADLQKKFNYDPAKAAAAIAAQQAADNAALQQQAAQRQNAAEDSKYDAMFAYPPKGGVGQLGKVMRIRATFSTQLKPDVATVHFSSLVVEEYTDDQGRVHAGENQYDDEIAVYGLPASFAEGSQWTGIVYPAGVMTFGMDKLKVYCTDKAQAIALLKQQGQ